MPALLLAIGAFAQGNGPNGGGAQGNGDATPPVGSVERSVVLPAPRARVWQALTTVEGICAWLACAANVRLEPGGPFELRPTAADGQDLDLPHGRVLALVPGEMLSHSGGAPDTWFVWRLADRDDGRVELRVNVCGRGAAWTARAAQLGTTLTAALARLAAHLTPSTKAAPDAEGHPAKITATEGAGTSGATPAVPPGNTSGDETVAPEPPPPVVPPGAPLARMLMLIGEFEATGRHVWGAPLHVERQFEWVHPGYSLRCRRIDIDVGQRTLDHEALWQWHPGERAIVCRGSGRGGALHEGKITADGDTIVVDYVVTREGRETRLRERFTRGDGETLRWTMDAWAADQRRWNQLLDTTLRRRHDPVRHR